MQGEAEAILILAPAPAAYAATRERAQSLDLAAGVSNEMEITPMPSNSGTFMRFIWLPTVAGEIVRLCWAPSLADAVATDDDRAYAPGVEYSVWVDKSKAWVAGLSDGGGELSWNIG